MPLFGSQGDRLNAPPPNPVTSQDAANESSPIQTTTGGQPPGQPGSTAPGGMPGGVDMNGVLMLFEKAGEACLTLAQMVPAQAGLIDTARAILDNAAAQFAQTQAGIGASLGQPSTPPPGGTSQAGAQFPGGGFQMGRPF